MLARIIINTESTVGYNSKLKQALPGMKLGVNNEVNPGTKKAGIKLKAGGPSKINPPNGHPSNSIQKVATAESKPCPSKGEPDAPVEPRKIQLKATTVSQHGVNKTAVLVGVVGVSALLLMALER